MAGLLNFVTVLTLPYYIPTLTPGVFATYLHSCVLFFFEVELTRNSFFCTGPCPKGRAKSPGRISCRRKMKQDVPHVFVEI
jgi:hypothetical protein